MSHSVNTGLSSGSFHSLNVLRNGAMEDILSIITAMVAGGITTINAGAGITVSGTGTSRTIASTCLSTLVAGSNIQITGSGTSRTIAATGGGAGTILQLGGTTQSGATTLNFVGAVGSLAGSVLSITAQPAITATTDIALQDATLRNITASAAAMTIKGGVITYIQDNLGANIMDIQASRVEFLKQVNLTQATTAYTAVTLHDATANRHGQLWIASNNQLMWRGQEVPDLPTILGLLASKITSGQGLTRTSNSSTGAVEIALDLSFAHPQLSFSGTTNTLRNITNQVGGTTEYNLTWGSDTLATQPWATSGLATKQNALSFQSEITPSTNLDLSNETASTPSYITWPGMSGVVNSTGYQSLNAVYKMYTSLTAGATIYFNCEFRAGTTSSVILSVNDSTQWAGAQHSTVTGLSTTTWTTVTWSFTVYSNGTVNFHIGHTPPGVTAVTAGSVHIRNYRLSTKPNTSAFTSKLTVAHDIVSSANISCVALTQTSDRAIKKGIKDASLDDLQAIFDNVEAKTYTRTDIEGNRLGFIAQDVQEKLPPEIGNLVHMKYETGTPLLALDYSRLVCCLWGVTKRLQQRIEVLEQAQTKKKTAKSKA